MEKEGGGDVREKKKQGKIEIYFKIDILGFYQIPHEIYFTFLKFLLQQ